MIRPDREPGEPAPRTRARSFALLFGGFAAITSIVIFFTEEDFDLVDRVFIGGFSIVFSRLAYFLGLHVLGQAGVWSTAV